MIKRLFWFTLGMFAGIFGWRYAKEKAKDAASQITFAEVASDVLSGVVKLVNQGFEIIRNLRAEDSSLVHQDGDSLHTDIK
jgi:hypothetical protein